MTVGHFVVVFVFPAVERRLPKSRWAPSSLQISYQEGRGVLRTILAVCTQQEFSVSRFQVERQPAHLADESRAVDRDQYVEQDEARAGGAQRTGIVTLQVEVRGARSVAKLAARLSEIEGVTSVLAGDANITSD